MDREFLKAVRKVLKHEGGYVNNPADKGGETNFGISKRSYPDVDIANLTRHEAMRIYYKDWWEKYEYYKLPPYINAKIFDIAINMGAKRAHLYAQRALKACGYDLVEDGILGPNTIAALKSVNREMFLACYKAECANHYRNLAQYSASQKQFLKGWLRRAYA